MRHVRILDLNGQHHRAIYASFSSASDAHAAVAPRARRSSLSGQASASSADSGSGALIDADAPAGQPTPNLRAFVPPAAGAVPALPGKAASKPAEHLLLQPNAPILREPLTVPSIILIEQMANQRKWFVRPPPAVQPDASRATIVSLRPPDLTATGTVDLSMPALKLDREPKLPVPIASSSLVPGDAPPEHSSTSPGTVADSSSLVSLSRQPLPDAGLIALPPANHMVESGNVGGPFVAGGASGKNGLGVASNTGRTSLTTSSASGDLSVDSNGSGAIGRRATFVREAVASAISGPQDGKAATKDISMKAAADLVAPHSPGPGRGTADTSRQAAHAERADAPSARADQLAHQDDLIVIQSQSAIPGSAGLLSGRPVYSVYLSVSGAKQWILQYCALNTPERSRNGVVVTLDAVQPIVAPYPVNLAPVDVDFATADRYAFVHGYVNTSGDLVSTVEAGEHAMTEPSSVLQTVASWRFRPAMKDGVPVTVEILLCIPNERM